MAVFVDLVYGGGTHCCRGFGDLRVSSCYVEAFLFIYIFQIGNTLWPFSILIGDPFASDPELAWPPSPAEAPVA